MPIYEYVCESCGRLTEAMQRIADPPLTTCPHCQGKLRKRISAPAFQFKGSGWYVTDYAKKSGGAPEASKDSAPASETSEAKAEKPSTATEAKPASPKGGDSKD